MILLTSAAISFAYHEMRLVIAALLVSFDLEVQKESEKWGINQKVYFVNEKKVCLSTRTIEISG